MYKRHVFSRDELDALKELYAESGGYPTILERRRLMTRFDLPKRKVFVWFQNRRYEEKRWRKEKLLK